jgi:hypothetical protein
MRLARIRSSNPKQVLQLRQELRSAGYIVESLGLSAASPWKADLELLVEMTSRSADAGNPGYRIFLDAEGFGPVHSDIAQALNRADSIARCEIQTSRLNLRPAMYAALSISAVIILIVLVLAFLISLSVPLRVRDKAGVATNSTRMHPSATTNAEQLNTSAELTPKPTPKFIHRPVTRYREAEVVITHFTTQEPSRAIKRSTDMK